MKSFIYIVDSNPDVYLLKTLNSLGLTEKPIFMLTDADTAETILDAGFAEELNAERLLVLLSSFHGKLDGPVRLARLIKSQNPSARIIFRSATETSTDLVFEANLSKSDAGELYQLLAAFADGK